MCIKKVNGKWKFDTKNTLYTIVVGIAGFIVAWNVITSQCTKCVEAAQDKYVRPIAEKVFDQKISPFNCQLNSMEESQKIIIEMLKENYGDSSYAKARKRVLNAGRWEGE